MNGERNIEPKLGARIDDTYASVSDEQLGLPQVRWGGLSMHSSLASV